MTPLSRPPPTLPADSMKHNATAAPCCSKTPRSTHWPFTSPAGCHRRTSPVLDPEGPTRKNKFFYTVKQEKIWRKQLKEISILTVTWGVSDNVARGLLTFYVGWKHVSFFSFSFLFNLMFYVSFCLIWLTCNIAFNFTHETGNRLLGGMSALCCCCLSWVTLRRKDDTVLYICPAGTWAFFFLVSPSFLRGVSWNACLWHVVATTPNFCPTWAFTVSVPVCRFGKCVCMCARACACVYFVSVWCVW